MVVFEVALWNLVISGIFGSLDVLLEEKLAFKNRKIYGGKISCNELIHNSLWYFKF